MTPKEENTPLEKLEDGIEALGENIDAISENIEEIEKKLGVFHPVSLLATWFGAGKIPFMPGTMGTLAALPFAYLIHTQAGPQALFVAALLMFLLGILVAEQFMKLSFTSHDPKEIVIDEVAGVWLLLVAMPPTVNGYLAGFLIFRLFDILKPWPISVCDNKVLGGFGVMLDDFAAAVYPVFLIGLLAMFSGITGSSLLVDLFNLLDGNVFLSGNL